MPTTKPQDNAPAIVNNSYTFIINNTYIIPINFNPEGNPASVPAQAEASSATPEETMFNLPNSVPVTQQYVKFIIPPPPKFKPTPQVIPDLAPVFSFEELNLLEEKSRMIKQQNSAAQVPPTPMLQSQSTPQMFPDLPSITSEEELKLREEFIEPQNLATMSELPPSNNKPRCPLAKKDGTILGTIFEHSDEIEQVLMQNVTRPELKTTTDDEFNNHTRKELKPIAKISAERPLFKTTTKDKPVKQPSLKPKVDKHVENNQLLFNIALRGSGVVIYESIIKAYNFLKDNDRKNFYPYAQLFKNHMKGYDIFEDHFSIISNLVQDQYDNERETTDCCLPFFAKKSNKVADYHNTTLTAKFIRLFLNIDALLTTADIALAFEKDISALIESKGANLSACTAKR